MKIPIIVLIFVMCFGTFFLADSNALIGPPAPHEDPSILNILVQIQIRNSEGMLVVYVEPSTFYLNNMYLIHQYLDEQENKKIIIIDGKSYEQIVFQREFLDSDGGQRASISLWKNSFPVLNAKFNGYIGQPGDTGTVSWKIIRTIQ